MLDVHRAVNGKAVPPQQPPADRRSHAAILEVIDRPGLLDKRYLANTPQLIPSRGWRLRAGHWRAINPSVPGSMTVTSGTSTAQVRAVSGPDLSDSQADSAGSIPVTRSTNPQVSDDVPLRRLSRSFLVDPHGPLAASAGSPWQNARSWHRRSVCRATQPRRDRPERGSRTHRSSVGIPPTMGCRRSSRR